MWNLLADFIMIHHSHETWKVKCIALWDTQYFTPKALLYAAHFGACAQFTYYILQQKYCNIPANRERSQYFGLHSWLFLLGHESQSYAIV